MPRSLLRKQLQEAWHHVIDQQYNAQAINSERGLQVYFCHVLMDAFTRSKIKRRLFIEPALRSALDGKYRYPDVVICDSRSVIGVVELKYLPRGRPSFTKDIETLAYAATSASGLQLCNDRYRGIASDDRSYPLAKDAVLCWGGIYSSEDAFDIRASIKSSALLDRFLQLNALTRRGQNPEVECK